MMFRRKPQPKPLPPAGYQPPVPLKSITVDHEPQLHPAQLHKIDWTEPEDDIHRKTLPAQSKTSYIPSHSELLHGPDVHVASPEVSIVADIVPAGRTGAIVQGSHVDRANAWLRYSLPLSIVTALVVTVAAKALYAFPLLSWSTFITLGLSFMVAYGLLLFRYWETSPEGVALYHTKQLWRLLHSRERHNQQIELDQWQQHRKMIADRHQDDRRARRDK